MTTQEEIAEAGKIVTETRRACSVKHPHDICSACVTTMLAAALAEVAAALRECNEIIRKLQAETDALRARLDEKSR
jgi:hypothetical protein